ncbi:MAG TPA: hypothetical protein IAD47_00355 [Candidatus Limihabitans stercoravium]|nr:hypothetical protein [Candidatus Limihabitans stercoravium]
MTDCKFKDFDALLNGYKALEKQFTKKCQEVAQLKQMCQSDTHKTGGTSVLTPPLSQEEFFSSYPNAERFRTEIVNNVTAPKYSNCYDAYVRCYLDIVDSLDVGKLLADKQFVQQYIVSNDAIVDAVLDKVFSANAPVLIGGRGGNMSVALPTRPKTIAEASLLAKEYFK